MLRSIASMLLGSVWLALATLVPVPAQAAGTDRLPLVAIEFYHPGLDHYFVTASPLEISALTSGQFSGWVPTGYSFPVLAPDHAVAGSTPVCRFYGNPSAGLDSHFYSASPKECGDVRTKFPEAWLLESENVFRVFPADAQTGACPADTEEVRRLYNRRADANHRYTDKDDVALSMLPKGYVPEGYGPSVLPTAFCVPKASENVTCTAVASDRQPVIGTAITLTANCTGNPVAYQWTGCTSSGGNTCTAISSSTGARAYVVTASTGTATSRPAIASVVWQPSRANPAPPATSIACTLAASNLSPVVGDRVTLSATCTGAPTRYTWSGCSGTGTTCTATAGAPGAVTYSVSASNGTFNSVTTPIIVTWKAATAFACALAASNPSPQINTSVTLTAKCTGGTPTAFAWTGCASTTSTCSTASANSGARTYAISVTSANGATAPASTSVNWQAAPAPAPSPSAVACTVNPSTVTPVVNTPLTLTATCSGAPTSYAWTGCASTTSTCNTTSTSTGSATYSLVARNASSVSPAVSSTVNWVAVPPVPAGMPTSADFLSKAGDPRGGDAGYTTFKRLPNGKGIAFGGFSHNRSGNNAVVTYDPVANSWQTVYPHTPWIDTSNVAGRSFLGNRDNHNVIVHGQRNEYWVFTGQRGVDLVGNYRGVLNTKNWGWQVDDTSADFLPITADTPPTWINSAAGWIDDIGVGYIFGGAKSDNPYDGLVRIESNPAGTAPFKLTILANQWNSPSFAGAEKLRYISNSHFVRQGKVYVYGGGHELRNNTREAGRTLYAIDVTVPSMSVVSINNLPAGQRVEGEAILADRDPAKDILVATDGVRVNVFDFASGTWTNVPVNTPADDDRKSPSPAGAGRQGFWSPEIQQFVILGGHGRVYGLRLNYGAAPAPTPTPAPSPTPSPAPNPSPVPAPAPPGVTPGTLKITATPVPYSGAAGVLGSSKHLDFARLGNRWYKMVGDHARIDATSPSTQSGRQEILSFTTTANDWNVDQMHYIWDPKQAQLALPDDAFAIARGDEIFAFVSTRTGTITQPAGVALQVDKLMAWKPGRGWRVVRDHIGEYRSGRAWRGIYDPIRDRFIVPAYFNGLVWVLIGGDGTDQTAREPNGAPKTSGNHALHVTGIAVDLPTRTAYAYDHHTSELFSVNLDTLALTKLANLPEAAASDEATFKLTWHPGLRSVIIGARKMHAYEVDSGRLTTWSRPDGYTNKIGKHVPSSTIFYDPDTQDVISIGGIDWETGMNPGVYWRLKITR